MHIMATLLRKEGLSKASTVSYLMQEVALVPMNEDQFQRYLGAAIQRYSMENVKAGYWTKEEAGPRSEEAHLRLLPEGLVTPGVLLFVIQERGSGTEVGALLLKIEGSDPPIGFIYDIFLEEEHRGKGLGKATMKAMEEMARQKGLRALYLHVFAHNPVALRLYEHSGFKVKSMNMEKRLD